MTRTVRYLRYAAVGLQLIQPPHHFQPADPARKLEFPRDHGAHRDAAYEWWYWTGHLNEIAGFQATVFRISPPGGHLPASGNRPEKASWLIIHTGLSNFKEKSFTHRAWAIRERQDTTRNQSHTTVRVDDGKLGIKVPGLNATMPGTDSFKISFDLPVEQPAKIPSRVSMDLVARKPLTLHGENGYSRKGPCATCASHYYSFSRLAGTYAITDTSKSLNGVPASGTVAAWYDHEFGSQSIDPAQAGWDWFSIQLDDPAEEIMLFQVRGRDASKAWRAGTRIDGTGASHTIEDAELIPEGSWRSSRSGGTYPAAWKVTIPSRRLALQIVPRFADQEAFTPASSQDAMQIAMPTYWEGACLVLDAGSSKKVGRAYLEMTGYAPGSTPRF